MLNQFTRPWTQAELEYLQENFKQRSYSEIGKQINRTYSSIQSKIRNLKINKRINKHAIDSNFFKTFSPEMAYVLGFVTADGNLYKSSSGFHIHIACDDYDVIEKIRTVLNSSTLIRKKFRTNGKISFSLRFSDKRIYNDLLSLDVTPKKSLTIKPPSIPKEFLRDYIRGFFDGDGSVYIYNRPYPSKLNTVFYTASYDMAVFLRQQLVDILGNYTAQIHTRKSNNYYYKLNCGQKHSEKLFHYLYLYDGATIFMQRKHDVFVKGMLV